QSGGTPEREWHALGRDDGPGPDREAHPDLGHRSVPPARRQTGRALGDFRRPGDAAAARPAAHPCSEAPGAHVAVPSEKTASHEAHEAYETQDALNERLAHPEPKSQNEEHVQGSRYKPWHVRPMWLVSGQSR